MSNRNHGKKNSHRGGGGGNAGGGQKIDKGNFDELMIIEELFPNAYDRSNDSKVVLGNKKLKTNEEEVKVDAETPKAVPEVTELPAVAMITQEIPIPQMDEPEQESPSKEEVAQDTQNIEKEQNNSEQQQEQKEELNATEETLPKEDEQNITTTSSTVAESQVQKISASDRLERELQDLKTQKDKLLFNVNTDVKCTVFLKVNSKLMENVDVAEVVETVMQRVHVQKTSLTRFCHRMFPAEFAFKASEENLRKYMPILIERRLNTDAPSSWMLEIKSRNNNKFNRKNVLDIVTEFIPKHHFVDYKNPFYTIVVDVCHNLMCLCILKNFVEYKKYSVKVNPQFNNAKDFHPPVAHLKNFASISNLPHRHHNQSAVVPVTEEEKRQQEKLQEETREQLRTEFLAGNQDDQDDEEIDLI